MNLPGLAVLCCVSLAGARTQEGENPPGGRPVPARTIPTPAAVSPELQGVIARPILVREKAAKIEPLNVEEWRLLIVATNEAVVAPLLKMRMTIPVKVDRQTIAGVRTHVVTPTSLPESNRGRVLVHLHGGAYVFYGGEFGLIEAILIAHHAKMKVISVDYRMPPDHPFPAGLEDSVAVWKEVTATSPPANTGLFGSSAGGGLTMATVLKLKEQQAPLPGALFLGTPWADLTKTGDTLFTNAQIDDVLVTHDGILKAAARLYAGSQPLDGPFLSPIGGDLAGFPPTVLISGTRDLFLSDTVRVHRKLRASGVAADLHVFEGLSHAQYLDVYNAPEARDAFGEVARFFDQHLAK